MEAVLLWAHPEKRAGKEKDKARWAGCMKEATGMSPAEPRWSGEDRTLWT